MSCQVTSTAPLTEAEYSTKIAFPSQFCLCISVSGQHLFGMHFYAAVDFWDLERKACAAQLIREAITQHTGEEPPKPPPPPRIKAYGEVGLYENVTLRSQIRRLCPGNGVTSRRPLITEEYGQSCVSPGYIVISPIMF